MARILILEDDPEERAYLEDAVDAHPELAVACAARTCEEAHRALEAGGVDAAVLDLVLPDDDGFRVLERATALGVPALIMTVLGDEATIADAITKGASGYLLKDTDSDRVGEAIERVLAGEAPLNARVARYLLDRLPPQREQPRAGEDSPLTPAERRVLELIASGHTHTECAETLQRSAHTVSTHIKNIYAKLSVSSRAEAVSSAVAQGLIDPERLVADAPSERSS